MGVFKDLDCDSNDPSYSTSKLLSLSVTAIEMLGAINFIINVENFRVLYVHKQALLIRAIFISLFSGTTSLFLNNL